MKPFGTIDKEHKCIAIAKELQLKLLENELTKISALKFDFAAFFDLDLYKIDLPHSEWGKAKRVLMVLFCSPLLLIILLLLLPYLELHNLLKQIKARKSLTSEFMATKSFLYESSPPEEKTLKALWQCYGIDEKYGKDNQLNIISCWIEILYGKQTRQTIDLEQIATTLRKEQITANTSWYKKDPDATKFYFNDSATSLVRFISENLPPYSESVVTQIKV